MANRILLGNRSTGGYGLYVSKSGQNVLDTTQSMMFDHRAGNSWSVKKIQEGTLTYGATTTVDHGIVDYYPLFAVRWCTVAELDGNSRATKVYNSAYTEYFRETMVGGEPLEVTRRSGIWVNGTASKTGETFEGELYIKNNGFVSPGTTIYYAAIVFFQEDFTGGVGL